MYAPAEPRPISYADLGGIDHVLADIRELIENPLQVWHAAEDPIMLCMLQSWRETYRHFELSRAEGFVGCRAHHGLV